jgi:hypothetical protein
MFSSFSTKFHEMIQVRISCIRTLARLLSFIDPENHNICVKVVLGAKYVSLSSTTFVRNLSSSVSSGQVTLETGLERHVG